MQIAPVTRPSDDFSREPADDAAVANFREMNSGFALPSATITPVTTTGAHSVFALPRDEHGAASSSKRDNFLIEGKTLLDHWVARMATGFRSVVRAVEAVLR